MTNYLKLVFHLGETVFKDLGQVTDSDLLIIIDESGLMLTLLYYYVIVTFSLYGLETWAMSVRCQLAPRYYTN